MNHDHFSEEEEAGHSEEEGTPEPDGQKGSPKKVTWGFPGLDLAPPTAAVGQGALTANDLDLRKYGLG